MNEAEVNMLQKLMDANEELRTKIGDLEDAARRHSDQYWKLTRCKKNLGLAISLLKPKVLEVYEAKKEAEPT